MGLAMDFDFHLAVVLAALILEALFGYPGWLFRRIGHPVVWAGALVGALDRLANKDTMPETMRRLNGGLAVVFVLIATALAATLVERAAMQWLAPAIAILVTSLIAGSLIAQRSLYRHVRAVASGLDQGLPEARLAIAKIAGRDPESLDGAGVARAAVESLAENYSDGVVAPVFWGVLFGLPGIATYKAINTADSMIGYRNERYGAFGWAAARLDDMVNLPCARLAAFWIVLAAIILPGAHPWGAIRAALADAHKHRSPNAGWPEAAMAGALGFRLAGPRVYDGHAIADSWMGDGNAELASGDIRRALRLFLTACAVQIAALAGFAAIALSR